MHATAPPETPDQKTHHALGRNVLWAGLLTVVAILVRLPIWLLPGPGRDEAAYHYWAHHPEPAYAPLVQWTIRLGELMAGHSLWALRGPMLILGFLVIWLNDRRLQGAGTSRSLRWLAIAAIAFNPWQSFAGAILHPDNFMLAALLGLLLAVQHDKLWIATLCTIGAVLAKPTGILFLPVTWWLINHMDSTSNRQRIPARLVLVITALAMLLLMKTDMISGMADFGHLSPTLPWFARLSAATGSLFFLGGPVLVVLAGFGVRQRLATLALDDSGPHQREARASLALAGVMIVVFLAAALLRGQFKGNWVLPALVILWPAGRAGLSLWPRISPAVTQRLLITVVSLTLLTSIGQSVIMARPELIAQLEEYLSARNAVPRWIAYQTQAGVRETAVSTSRSWSDHLREYEDISDFSQQLLTNWQAHNKTDQAPTWIIDNDYGLACQLHWYFADETSQVAICDDGIFHRTWSHLRSCAPQDPLLALALPSTVGEKNTALKFQAQLPDLLHPITGRTMNPKVMRWPSTPHQEPSHVEIPE